MNCLREKSISNSNICEKLLHDKENGILIILKNDFFSFFLINRIEESID